MTEILPNQKGEQPFVNKEKEIIENGGEKTTDQLSNIKLLSTEEWAALKNDEKALYVRYNPSLTSQAYAQTINGYNALITQFNQLGPMLAKAPDLKGLENIANMLEPAKTAANAISTINDSINALSEALGKVGLSALTGILTSLATFAASMTAIYNFLIRNPYTMIKQYSEALENVDWETLEAQFKGETTENIDTANLNIQEMVIPDDEIRDYVDKNLTQLSNTKDIMAKKFAELKNLKEMVEKAKTVQETVDSISLAMDGASGGLGTMAKNVMVTTYEQNVDGTKKDYTKDSKEMVDGVNNFIHNMPAKFIKVSDLETLRKIEKEKS